MNPKSLFQKKPIQEHQINENIFFPNVFLVGSDNEKIGKMPTREAIKMAKSQGLDLVLISIKEIKTKDNKVQKVPIAKILDYGKFRYDIKKKKKEEKEKQSFTNNREIRVSFNINMQDILVKSKKAREFILDGDRVKIALRFRGREITRVDQGKVTLDIFYDQLKYIAKKSKEISQNGNFLVMNLERDRKKLPKFTSSKQLKELLEYEEQQKQEENV
ncbi:translation initiation factor IF-3 [Mesomycoplasma dispar]|uniref:Translation initiation factor IF-3 n=1 Tax=Mesomycoplasma dispar TaxID=86660 RepID=A0AAJ5NQH5_9BACT|nr:translation initiation factor IF-3 [Mesomycoplasma dispar]AJR12035.1 translation initiation factor IF-3 [Mesomycoplasma dispar]ATP59507.1 translation initiation factor IF-3 [Mesomycoplasma dispar]VEU61375.1 translation initiation factor IF-3 [Mesomycoplasma dispar]